MAFRPELGAQIKADASWVINDNFSYTTQVAAFYNYLKPTVEPRITWDNKVFWKLARFFALTLSTNLIYDPLVNLPDHGNSLTRPRAYSSRNSWSSASPTQSHTSISMLLVAVSGGIDSMCLAEKVRPLRRTFCHCALQLRPERGRFRRRRSLCPRAGRRPWHHLPRKAL